MSESINNDLLSSAGGSISNLSTISDGSNSTGTGTSNTNTNTSTSTSVSTKTATGSSVPRPSCLKVPNKLPRICSGTQKPPVPVSPKSSKFILNYFPFFK